MDSLRAQLAETQGALTERDKKFRQLRMEHTTATKNWEGERKTLQEKVQRLEAENQRLRRTSNGVLRDGASPARATDLSVVVGGVDGENNNSNNNNANATVTITRSRMQEIEARYQKVIALLTEKTKLCEALQQQLHGSSNSHGAPKLIIIPPPSTFNTDDQVVTHWNLLRERIRSLTLEHFNHKVFTTPVSEKGKQEFAELSSHWKTYLTTPSLTCYLFRALIWRYLQTCLFGATFGRIWGREVRNTLGQLSSFFSPSSPVASPVGKKSVLGPSATVDQVGTLRDWQTLTATLLERTRPIDTDITNELVDKICAALTPFATDGPGSSAGMDTDADGLRKAILEIVTMSAELSAAFTRAPFIVLMSDEPGSTRTQGFPYREATMEMRGKLSSQTTVDMMISPCLLKKDDDYEVLIKAEVVC
ncbi:hypothetical protein F5X96DRAFT_655363 [Biscogniauxia mediterranea]|nr:hypothetical protein F5X96DRAFT_655363 [Biscogniauxia mediterranea]